MTSKQKLLIANVAILIVAALAVWLLLRSSAESPSGARPAPAPAPRRAAGSAPTGGPIAPPAPDDDPAGPLLLEGQVLGPDGQPAGGATVLLASRPPRTATTEADGSFSFDRLVPRAYRLTAHRGDAIAGPLEHAPRAAGDPVVLRLVVGAVIDVTVVGAETGEPIAGATVGISPDVASAATDADGRARLAGVPRRYGVSVRATAPGRAPASATVSTPDSPGAVVTAHLALHAGASVSGVVVEAGGEPIAGARVTAFVAGDGRSGEVLDQPAVTDAAGRFRIPALAPGAYRFRARHRGHLDGTTTRSVDAAITDLRLELARGARVSGRVVGGRGAPAPWASVVLAPGMEGEQRGERHAQRITADRNGAFVLEGVPPRIFSVMASGEDATSQSVEVDLARGDRDGLVLALDVDGRIAGVVVDDAGRPVAEAVVAAMPDFMAGGTSDAQLLAGAPLTTTDGGGRFVFRGRPEGKYRLVAARTGNERRNPLEVGVKASTGDLAVRLVVSQPGRLRGRVRFADGSAPEAFSVQVGRRPPLAIASRKGEFVVPEVDPGRQALAVRGPGFAAATATVDVAPGAERDAGVILLDRGRTVRGRVLGAGSRPVAGAVVVAGARIHAAPGSLVHPHALREGWGSGIRRTVTDGDGRFELTGLEAADVVIAAEHEREGRSPAVMVGAGDDAAVDLHLAAFASVHGTVTRAGRPAAGLVWFTQRASHLGGEFEAGEDGVYELSRLAAGEYTITGPINHRPGEQTVTRTVGLEPGQRLRVDLAVDGAGPTLIVALEPAGDAPAATAMVSLVPGEVSPANVREMTDLGLDPSTVRNGAPTTGESRFTGLRPGAYSLCVTPMPAAATDPLVAARFFEHPERVPVRCSPITVAPAPPEQRHTAVAPATSSP